MTAASPEAAFDRRFAEAAISRAFVALREERRARGKEGLFETLSPFLDGAEPDGYSQATAQLGLAPGMVAVAVHRMRGRLTSPTSAANSPASASTGQTRNRGAGFFACLLT